jgi:hypothetical protein
MRPVAFVAAVLLVFAGCNSTVHNPYDSGVEIDPNDRDGDGIPVTGDCDDGDATVGGPVTWYHDADGDGEGNPDDTIVLCDQPMGYVSTGNDCADADPESLGSPWYADADGDSFGDPNVVVTACEAPEGTVSNDLDCDDSDADANPGGDEVAGNVVDEDCDGYIDCFENLDGDAFGVDYPRRSPVDGCDGPGESYVSTDCDDGDASVYPDAPETCDGQDDDCDGETDEDAIDTERFYADADRDGYGDPDVSIVACFASSGYVAEAGDCDDASASIHPGATESCDGFDNDCSGVADDVVSAPDSDRDGWGDTLRSRTGCPVASGYTTVLGDCDDSAIGVHPGASETCGNGLDDDCDGSTDGCGIFGLEELSGADAKIVGADAADALGSAVAVAGAAYLAGHGTLLIGAPDAEGSGTDMGVVYVLDLPVSGTVSLGSADARLVGSHRFDNAGTALAAPGDLDGDGWDDIAIGLPGADDAATDGGAMVVVFGPVTSTTALSSAGPLFTGEAGGDAAGESLAAAGDTNDDGQPDLLVGAFNSDIVGTASGAVYLLLGPADASESLGLADARLVGEAAGDCAGSAVAPMGDVDGDGFDDVLVGAWANDGGGGDAGAVYLVFGPIASGSLSDADVTIRGRDAGAAAGISVAGQGDVDGDGNPDLIVGAMLSGDGGPMSGAAYLLRGPFTRDTDLSHADLELVGASASDYAGSSVSLGSDIDGDGLSDVIVSAWGDDESATDAGAVYVLFDPPGGTLSLSEADARIVGEHASDAAGSVMIAPGDLNDDGIGDLLISATAEDTGGAGAGAVYLILGGGW